MSKSRVAAAVAAISLAGLIAAPNTVLAATKAGDSAVGGSATLSFSDAVDSISIQAQGSHFFTDAFEAGIGLGWSEFDVDGAEGSSFGGGDSVILVDFRAQYNFLTSGNTVPFVGAAYQYTGLGDFDDTDFYQLFAGLRQFVSENVAIRSEIRYSGAVDSDFDDADSTSLVIGLDWFF